MLTIREVMIMQAILTDSSVTIDSLAETFDVSKRTIRYDLENIEVSLFENKVLPSYISLMKDLNESDRMTIKDFLNELTLSSVTLSADERYKLVKYTLILLGKLNITKLGKELQVSRMTVKNDYDAILNELSSLNLSTELNYKDGFKLIGDEDSIRKLQLNVLNEISRSNYYNELLYSDLKNKVFKNFGFEGIDACLYGLQKKLGNVFSDQSYLTVKNYLTVTLIRKRKGFTLPDSKVTGFGSEKMTDDLLSDVNIIMKKYYDTELNLEELNDLNRLIQKSKYVKAGGFSKDYSIEIDQLVYKLINTFGRNDGVDLSRDSELFEGLISHLRPLILNQQMQAYESDITDEIKSEFGHVYKQVEESLNQLEIPFASDLIRQEVPFITVHFAAALQRNSLKVQRNKKILIVCSQGIGISKLLEQRLSTSFNAEVIDVIPLHYLEHYPHIDDVELIVTTVPIKKAPMNLPVVRVNAVLTPEDLTQLEKEGVIRRNKKIELSKLVDLLSPNLKTAVDKELIAELKSHFGNFIVDDLLSGDEKDTRQIKREFIQMVESVSDWEEAVRVALKPLTEEKYVTDRYVKEVVEAFKENGTYMFIGKGIAIPHARSTHVRHTGFSMLKLQQPVHYTEELSINMLICFSSEDNMNHLDTLISLVDHIKSERFIESLETISTADELADEVLSLKL